jgi:hypothetical protein
MKPVPKKLLRIAAWTALSAVLLAGTVYLLRWPLLGGIARAQLATLAAQHLDADLARVRLEGSLLWGLEATDLALAPRPGSTLLEASARRITVRYGFLGNAPPEIRLEGVRLAFRDRGTPADPPHAIARDALAVLDSLQFEGRAEARDATVVLADGRVLAVAEASLEGSRWTARLRDPLFGDIQGSAETTPAGAVVIVAHASAGPIRAATLSIAPGRDGRAFAAELRGVDRTVRASGRMSYDGEKLLAASGEIALAEGNARATLDFERGQASMDVDGALDLPDPLQGRVAVKFRADGPASGPLEAWTIRGGKARSEGPRLRHLRFDEAEVEAGEGRLAGLPVRLRVRRADDLLEADGTVRWTEGLSAEGNARATAGRVEPYLELLPSPPPVRASTVVARGKVAWESDRFTFDGDVTGASGNAGDLAWDEFRIDGRLALPGSLEVHEARIAGSPFASDLRVRGRLEDRAFTATFEAGGDRGEVEGRLEDEGLPTGRFRLDGPLAWFGLRTPGGPWTVSGTLSRDAVDAEVESAVGVGSRLRFTFRRTDTTTTFDVAPGIVRLPDDRLVHTGAFRVQLAGKEVKAEGLRARLSDPPVEVAGDFELAGGRATLSLPEVRAFEIDLGPLSASIENNVLRGTLGPEAGNHLRVEGSVGERLDLRVEARIPDLRSLRADLEGEARLALQGRGTLEAPEVQGELALQNLSTAGLPRLTLPIAIESAGRRLRVRGEAEPSPYGRVVVEGELPFLELGGSERLDLRVDVESKDLDFVLARLPEPVRPWIPPARAKLRGVLAGTVAQPVWSAELEAAAPRFRPPASLGVVDGLRIRAAIDASGLELRSLEGTMGLGAFRARGRWDLFATGRPLSLTVSGRNLLAVDTDLVRLRVSPDVVLTWNEESGAKLSGRAEVPLLLFHREFEPPAPAARENQAEAAAPRLRLSPADGGGYHVPGIEGLDDLALDLEIATAGDVRIENSVVAAILEARGRVTGRADRPVVSGVLTLRKRKGEIKIGPGTFLRIDEAEAILPSEPGKAATVDLQGRSGIGDAAIYVRILGPLSAPSLSLHSNPARSQQELLARLAFGQGPGTVSGAGAGGTAALRLFTELQEDRPTADRSEGFLERLRPSVVTGEDPDQRRVPWELPPTGSLRGTALRTEYVLNSFFSIVAETNQAGDVAGDLKLRIRF